MLKRKQPLALPKSSHSNSYYFTMNDRAVQINYVDRPSLENCAAYDMLTRARETNVDILRNGTPVGDRA